MQLYPQFLFPMYLIKSNRLQNIFLRMFLSQDGSFLLIMLSMIISKCSKHFLLTISSQNKYYISQVISMEMLCFTEIHTCKSTANRKESYMHNSWELKVRNCTQPPCCFINFNTPFNLLLLVGLTASLSKSKQADLTGNSKTLEYFL